VLHKHHLIIRVGAGLIQFVYGSHSRFAADLTLDKNLFFLPFSRAFLLLTIFNIMMGDMQHVGPQLGHPENGSICLPLWA